ncbi:DDB1- and CUL4-associated factor homolog 1-like [Macadamia integrifolia]|uniref:DDB1- and CUL4-associated factor homolog 1-like n=1 Tax=Macadamia integrifolia TaxID=60698 RepID=UPI001C4E7B7B|nr:DDB1- and CUL4-associated factor homolog 1-like [Macadamia integrifolia]
MESATNSLQPPAEPEEPKNVSEDEILLSNAQNLISKITSSQENPNPKVLNALASILETQESKYMEESGHSLVTNGRASHSIGRLGNLVRENDDFFELISSKLLTETRYSTSICAASARLLLSCSTTWLYPHVFEDAVLENIKSWVLDDKVGHFGDEYNGMHDSGKYTPTDSEMLRTYATGLLAVCLSGGDQVVEDVLTSGLSAKLVRYLRARVLGETSTSQKDSTYRTEYKNTSGASSIKGREECRGRFRQVLDATQLDGPGLVDEGFLDDQSGERDHDKTISIRQARGEECWDDDGESPREYADDLSEGVDVFDVDEEDVGPLGEEKIQNCDGKAKFGDRYGTSRSMREEDCEENIRDDSSRCRTNRGWARIRGKGRANEGVVDNDRVLTPPGSGIRLGGQSRAVRERNQIRNQDVKRLSDAKKFSCRIDANGFVAREDNDDHFQECKVGARDISDVVTKAVRAAEAEARAANASAEAIKAAGDAAAELVKSAAIEEFKSTNDEEAAVLVASKAASTVIDAANATEVSRSSNNLHEDSIDSMAREPEKDEELEGSFVLDNNSLAQLREKYCIQCLEILGGYVEVLGPVLHEKGVDVCLALLQRSSKNRETANITMLLPDVLKLICALAAHRKFAALLVDRGGMQKLLAVPRVSQTFFGLSSCLFTIGSLQGIMERVCAFPPDIVNQVVELSLQLLECPRDQARKNAAVFFAAAFVFRAVVDSFDAQDGLQKFLNLLHGAASVRPGGNSGTHSLSILGSLQNDQSPAEVLTASEKQVAYHTCVALRQYLRAHLILLVDSIRPNKNRSVIRHITSAKAAYKPLDISNEAVDAVFLQIQRDRKLGHAFARARWLAVDKFLVSNGHIIMLELCQAPAVDRYLHDLAQYALGVLHIVTLVPYSHKMILNATLSNHRVGMAVILDAANGAGYVDPEQVIQPALNVLVNLVCPPPSISNKPAVLPQGQQSVSIQASNGSTVENRGRHAERNILDRNVSLPIQNESREWNGEFAVAERGCSVVFGMPASSSNSQAAVPNVTSRVVGDRRISLGPGAGCAGLAAQLEQGYHQAREAVRAHNGIKVLLHLLHPHILTPPGARDCIRALACRVLLGLARDESIAHILTMLQVGKKLSKLIRDSGNQMPCSEQGRWHTELGHVAIELIGIVTNSGRASSLAATDAAAPTLRRIERAAIAAATPITYHSRELLLLIHEHLQASGLTSTAALLLKEAQLIPLASWATPPPLLHQIYVQETPPTQIQWPSGRTSCGFVSNASKPTARDEDSSLSDSVVKKPLIFSSNVSFQSRNQPLSNPPSTSKSSSTLKYASAASRVSDASAVSALKPFADAELQFKTPIVLPIKRKLTDFKDGGFASPGKRHATGEHLFQSPICQTPITVHRSSQPMDSVGLSGTPSSSQGDQFGRSAASGIVTDNLDNSQHNISTPLVPVTPSSSLPSLLADSVPGDTERVTLDHLVVQYLEHQHHQCSAPITTLPPLSLLYPHVCPESRRNVDAPANVTARLSTRGFRNHYGGIHGNHKDRQFVYSRFRPWRTCRDDATLLTCIAFLGDSSQIATGSHSGELKIFDSNSGIVLESYTSHQSPVSRVQSSLCGDSQLILSSGSYDVRLWDASSVSAGPMRSFEGCKSARFSNSGTTFAALSSESTRREVLLYDIQTFNLELKLSDTSTISSGLGRGHVQSLIHFSPSDTMLLWNGVLWDRRDSGPVHRFDQFTDYGGGGFHPAGNEVIINSEVWDLRKFKLLRSIPSLDQTVITFNGRGDVIYAILRRNLLDITSAVNTRRVRHPLFSAFRTVDAINYSDIATVPVDRCVLDFSTEPTDSFVGLVSMDDHEEMFASARLYEIGRRRPTDDDSDPDDAETEEDDDDNEDSEADEEPISGTDLDADIDSDGNDMSNDDDDDGESMDGMDEDDDGDFVIDDVDFDAGTGILEITEGDEEEDS